MKPRLMELRINSQDGKLLASILRYDLGTIQQNTLRWLTATLLRFRSFAPCTITQRRWS